MSKGRAQDACLLVIDSHYPLMTLMPLISTPMASSHSGVLQVRQLNRDDASRFKTYAPLINIPRLYRKWLHLLLTRHTIQSSTATRMSVICACFENRSEFETA